MKAKQIFGRPKVLIPLIAALVIVLGGGAYTLSQSSPAVVHGQTTGWHVTTYYTPVEVYHTGNPETVTGCTSHDCSHGHDNLGDYPNDFVAKVKSEGAGRITAGPHSGHYLNWSSDTGFWLDSIPSDAEGRALQPLVSAAADSTVLPQHASFKLQTCGNDANQYSPIACQVLKNATWKVTDHFEPGLGSAKHVDLYIGEENQTSFENSSLYVDLTNVTLSVN